MLQDAAWALRVETAPVLAQRFGERYVYVNDGSLLQ